MTKSLGPWTTAIDSGATLSAFWKQRLTRVPELADSPSRVSRRSAVGLVVCGLLAIGWPTAKLTLEVAAADPPKANETPVTGDVANAPGQVFSVELNDGVRAEILGLCDHPSRGNAWWAADGRPIAAPYQFFNSRANNPEAIVREIAMMIHVPPNADVASHWGPVGNSAFAGGMATDAQGKPLRSIDAAAVALPANLDTAVIQLSVAAGPWTTMTQTDGRTWGSEGKRKHGYVYTPAIEADSKVTISIAHNVLNRDLRIVALGADGKILANGDARGGGAANFRQTVGIFKGVALEDVHAFQLQARPYHKYEIQNVSLHRDRHTVPAMIDLGVDEEEN